MIITITSNTFDQDDFGEVSSSKPLDFVLNFNNKVMSYYSLNSTSVIQEESDYLWKIIESGKNESHGIDSALSRTFTIIKITGCSYEDWKRKEINFEIVINYYGGLGRSEKLSQIINHIKYRFDTLHQCDIDFLDRLSGENNKLRRRNPMGASEISESDWVGIGDQYNEEQLLEFEDTITRDSHGVLTANTAEEIKNAINLATTLGIQSSVNPDKPNVQNSGDDADRIAAQAAVDAPDASDDAVF